jgi:GT2 family glycosyltransferase
MNLPFVSIVIDTITRDDYGARPLADDLQATLDGVARQTYPRALFETIVVVDSNDGGNGESDEVVRRYPWVSIVRSPQHSYFAGKNIGARASRGAIVALLDSDCEPVPEWLSMLTAPFADDGVSAVAGCTRYTGTSLHAWTFSVPDFSIVVGDKFGEASAFHLNNSAFRRETFLIHPLDARIRRDGGCVLLYHELRAAGERIMYAPQARVSHGLDFAQRGLLKKHFNRGFDGVTVYRADEHEVLRGTRLFRRFGALALIAFTGRRILLDWMRLIRNYGQMGISPAAIPYFAAVSVATRLIALTGGLTAVSRFGHATLATPESSR